MRLDRLDSYLTTFESRVAEVSTDDRGAWLRLERSAFYPTAGGQPHDTGTLGDRRVTDVEQRGGAVWHLIDGEATVGVGDALVGTVDWHRRFTHMQRHSAQHILSQAFVRVGKARGAAADGEPGHHTRSVSMRGADCTLDVTGEPDEEALLAAEAEVDEAARRAMPVMTFEVDESRLGGYALRRPAKVKGLVRLVAMGDYDVVACGGTHVRNTAEVLPVKLLGAERVRGGLTRVTFRAGAEAVGDHAVKHRVVTDLSQLLSAPVEELPSRVTALTDRTAGLEAALAGARRELAEGLTASALSSERRDLPGGERLVVVALRGADAELFAPVVDSLQQVSGCVSLVGVRDEQGARLAFLAGPGAQVDVRPALRAALEVIGGRGGGRPDRAQGAGTAAARLDEALEAGAGVLLG